MFKGKKVLCKRFRLYSAEFCTNSLKRSTGRVMRVKFCLKLKALNILIIWTHKVGRKVVIYIRMEVRIYYPSEDKILVLGPFNASRAFQIKFEYDSRSKVSVVGTGILKKL